jgi:hypothetical protein
MKTAPQQKVRSSSQKLLPTRCRQIFHLPPSRARGSREPENSGRNPEDERLMPENEPENCLKIGLDSGSHRTPRLIAAPRRSPSKIRAISTISKFPPQKPSAISIVPFCSAKNFLPRMLSRLQPVPVLPARPFNFVQVCSTLFKIEFFSAEAHTVASLPPTLHRARLEKRAFSFTLFGTMRIAFCARNGFHPPRRIQPLSTEDSRKLGPQSVLELQ